MLAAHFLAKHAGQMADPPPELSQAAADALVRWYWPGNVRELENAIARAVLISDLPVIQPEPAAEPAADPTPHLVGATVREVERRLIGETLAHVNNNRTHAAKMLGISIRTLRNKLKEYRELPPGESGMAAGSAMST